MTSSNGEQQGRGGGLMSALKDSPAVSQLGQAARDYAKARGSDAARKVGDKLSGVTESLTETSENGGFKASALGETARRVASGDNQVKAAVGGVGEGIKEKVKSAFGRSGGRRHAAPFLKSTTLTVSKTMVRSNTTERCLM